MPPFTLHAVITTETALCRGGHFYHLPSIVNTARAIIQEFAGFGGITNSDHTSLWQVLRQIMSFWSYSFHSEDVLSPRELFFFI